MLAQERGTCSGSDLYFLTPSENASRMLYYMTSCGYYFTNNDYRIQREDYNNYLIFYICKGRLSVSTGDVTMVATAGQIGFINCHIPHEYHTIGNTEFIWLHLDGTNTGQFYKHIMERHNGFVFDTPRAEEVKSSIYEIVSACRTEQLPNEACLSYKLYYILISLLDNRSIEKDTVDSDSPVSLVTRFIKEHYNEKISLTDMARVANMSKYHFSRLFKRECGYSPHEFMMLIRINCAKHLLKTTDIPVKVIAVKVGYQDVETFTNAFCRRVGLSPSRFRKYPI
ncbi:MAG TPA: hypothetical protein DDY59_12610 [Lachnospiraceae bacterium]|jgi:AraC-like DNA-binding protein|nr:hypothetical protein [Lachnospiraceae bacterium]HBR03626.1 hypothetical protein [Ruminiclostridium sp.]